MRAISLTMTAFGPYCEKQTIRFSDLGEESIFLITGPTGAGKTTIFDAICYALYGRASGSDRDQDSLRSHFATIDQPTEVTFVFGLKEKIYQVTRYPKQQKRKERGDGYTDDPARAELYEVDDDKLQLISSKIKDVNEFLEDQLGLDYEQFRKMIMIPQGEFRKLISENSKEREEILQKIFRTHFYQRITEELKKQAKELKQWIENIEWKMEQEIAKIDWVHYERSEEDQTGELLVKLAKEIDCDQVEKKEWQNKLKQEKELLKAAQNDLYAGKQLVTLFDQQEQLNKQQTKLDEQTKQMEVKQSQVSLAKQAQLIVPFEIQVEDRKKEWHDQQQKVTNQSKIIEKLTVKAEQVQQAYEQEKENESKREKLKEEIANKKQQLDKLKQLKELETDVAKTRKESEVINQTIERIQKQSNTIASKLDFIEKELANQNQSTKDYYQLEASAKVLQDTYTKLEKLRKETRQLVKLREEFSQVSQQFKAAEAKLANQKDELNILEEKQKQHHAFFLAKQLEQGHACPVCGSKEHPNPMKEHNPSVSEEQIKKVQYRIKEQEQELKRWQDVYIQVKSDGQALRKTVEELHLEFSNNLPELDEPRINEQLTKIKTEIDQVSNKKNELSRELKKLDDYIKERKTLQTNRKEQEEQLEHYQQLKENIAKTEYRIQAQVDQILESLRDPSLSLAELEQEIRNNILAYDKQIKEWEKIQELYSRISGELQEAKTVQVQLKSFLASFQTKYEDQTHVYKTKIIETGFHSEEEYQASKLSNEQQKALEQELETYQKEKEFVSSQLKALATSLKDKQKPDLSGLEQRVNELETMVEKTSEAIQTVTIRITSHERSKQKLEELQKDYQLYVKQFYDIGELADLARGENHLKLSFERYVLSSFLDEILLQANIRLDQLTEHRYQLIRSDQVAKRGAQSGLDLEVLDHHTGQQRSVKTLSGGEGFKAALSLALGMADVVQAHAGGVQLETLFIDEGFGTLDELSLEQAINCLKGLQQSNRVLGIISHVPQLKEEIHAKLQITPSPKGSSAKFVC
ncbi:AAA family ATPase [Aquibacillus salsiterrae]|uniref:Nuclease SbcCD subunit C n=1 Tax=Aquibacillus salsiterrae TaxID=2950439 RepID=A0A9X3WAQ9_9BACI|nr:AAA family ATPase [Aquibacillus salsiterrae]MDC3415317.1 AAA family ATPase [Aquibacillus salsiterrae]